MRLAAAAEDSELELFAVGRFHRIEHVFIAADFFVVDLQDNIVLLEIGFAGGAVGQHFANQRALSVFEIELRSDGGSHVVDLHADPVFAKVFRLLVLICLDGQNLAGGSGFDAQDACNFVGGTANGGIVNQHSELLIDLVRRSTGINGYDDRTLFDIVTARVLLLRYANLANLDLVLFFLILGVAFWSIVSLGSQPGDHDQSDHCEPRGGLS